MFKLEPAGEPAALSVWRAALAGLCATLVGGGLARFAYGPLIPALIEAGWFSPAQAGYLAAINLVGYVFGAAFARRLGERLEIRTMLRGLMLAAAASLLLCGFPPATVPGGFWWFALLRLAAGVSAGGIMILSAPAVLAAAEPARRGLVSGIIFTGVGLGIAVSAALIPIVLELGLPSAWWALAGASLLLTGLAWNGWPAHTPVPAPIRPRRTVPVALDRRVVVLVVSYGLNAFALVPHMVFLVDYVARGLGRGLAAGGFYWVVFGAGAAVGPLVAGFVGGRVGFARTARLGLPLQAGLVLLPVLSPTPVAIAISALLVGAFAPGTIPMALGRAMDLVGTAGQGRVWSWLTTGWALMQTVGAYAMSYLYGHGADYAVLFETGSAALLLAFAIEFAGTRRTASARPQT